MDRKAPSQLLSSTTGTRLPLLALAWALASACGPVDASPTADDTIESQAAPVEGEPPIGEAPPIGEPESAPLPEAAPPYVSGGWAGGHSARLTSELCVSGTVQLCADGTVSRCTLSGHTMLETLPGNYGTICTANTAVERHCAGGRLKKCTVPGNPWGRHGWFIDPANPTAYKGASGTAGNVAEFYSTGHIWRFVQSGLTNYHNGTSFNDITCSAGQTTTMYATGFVQSCTGGAKTYAGPTPPTGGAASLSCGLGVQSFHPDHRIASCTINSSVGSPASTAPTPHGMATCARGAAASLHVNGYLSSCALGADFVVNTSAGPLICQSGKPLILDNVGNVTSCTLRVEATVPTQRGADATCKANSTIGLTPAGDLFGNCVLKTALMLPRVPLGAAAAANMTCAANTAVTLTTDGYASRCTPTTNTVVGSARSGNVTCKANAQLTVFTSVAARGQLASCTPALNTSVVREAAPADVTSCAADLPLTHHEDGYLASCTLAAGTMESITGPAATAIRCSGGGTLAFHTDGSVAACRIADAETLPTERYGNLGCAATSALSFTSTAKVYGDCALTANAAVGFVPVGTAAAKAVTCKSGTALVLTSSGYASTCTPTAELAVAKTLKYSNVLSCQADHEVNVATSGTCVGCVLSCRVGGATNYNVYVEAIGEATAATPLGAKPGTDLELFDDGFVALATSGSATLDGVYGVPTYHDPNSTVTDTIYCKHNAAIAIQTGNRRLAMCTLGRPVATGVRSVDGKRRICPRFGVAEFATRGAGGGVYEVITQLDDVAAETACPLEPGEACTSNAQCAGTCNAGICGKVPMGGACTINTQCVSNRCDTTTTYTCV